MVAKADSQSSRYDALKWVLAIGIVLAGVYANSYFATESLLLRSIVGVAILAVVAAIALQTEQGRATWELAKEARVEIRKVVWPTPEERLQTTLIVVGVVIVVSLILWALDSGLSWVIKSVIG